MKKKFIYPNILSMTVPKENGHYVDGKCCTVLAVAHAYKMSFEDAQAVCARFGREKYRGMSIQRFHEMIDYTFSHCTKFVGVFGNTVIGDIALMLERKKTGEYPVMMNGITLGTFIKKYNQGTYIVAVRGHVTVVKDGKILSFENENANKFVAIAWKVE